MKKIILFATGPQDALQWCDENLIEFEDVTWVLSPEYLEYLTDDRVNTDSVGVDDELDYLCTPAFLVSDKYPDAHKYLKEVK